jgi:hypothetical protein
VRKVRPSPSSELVADLVVAAVTSCVTVTLAPLVGQLVVSL